MKRITLVLACIFLGLSIIGCTNLVKHQDEDASNDENNITEDTPATNSEDLIEDQISDVISDYNIGDIVLFGEYEQDGNKTNGKEKIAWRILDVNDNRLFVISEYILDNRNFDLSEVSGETTWENSDFREWLNDDFINKAFSEEEKNAIPTVTVKNIGSKFGDGTPDGNDTIDKLFCLSVDEFQQYFGDYQLYSEEKMKGYNYKLISAQTQNAISHCDILGQGVGFNLKEQSFSNPNLLLLSDENKTLEDIYPNEVIGITSGDWALRTMAFSNKCECFVSDCGLAGEGNMRDVSRRIGVRPAMYIELTSENTKLVTKGVPQKFEIKMPEYTQYTSSFKPGVVLADWDINMNPSDEKLAWKLSQDLDAYITTYCPDIEEMYVAEIISGTEEETSTTYSIKVKIKEFNDDGSDLIVKAVWTFGSTLDYYNFYSDLSPDGTQYLVDKDGNPIDWDSPINNPFSE